MNLFQLGALVGLIGGAMAGVCYGKYYGPWGSILYGILGGTVGFIGGVVMTPVVLLFGHVMDRLERKIGPSLRTPIVLGRKKPDKSDGGDDTK
jgi:hypothetical protein